MNHRPLFPSPVYPESRLAPLAIALTFALSIGLETSAAENRSAAPSGEAAIRASANAFIQAFNRADAKAVAELWTPAGTIASDGTEPLRGRPAIQKESAAIFQQHPGARMEIAIASIEFPTEALAIEDGTAQGETQHGGAPMLSRYTAVHVRDGQQWQIASVRETSIELPSTFAQMQELEWLIGDWQAKRDDAEVRTTFRWIANKSFIQRDYTLRRQGLTASTGIQIIGWNPQTGRFQSWSFDSSGGHGTGLWSPTADGWSIGTAGVLRDGTPTTSQDRLIRVPGEDNVLGWQSVSRTAGQTALPDTPEIVLDRIAPKH